MAKYIAPWPKADSSSTASGIWQNSNTISSGVTIAANYNGLTAGPVTISSTGSVTIPSGSVWTIV